MADQEVGRGTERRVRRDARVAVGTAALHGEHEFAGRDRLPLHVRRLRQHLLERGGAGLDRPPGAAEFLDGHGLDHLVVGDLPRPGEALHLVDLAAQPQHEEAGEVGMAGVARHRPTQDLEALAPRPGHAAAGAVRERHDAVDRREVLGDDAAHPFGDQFGRGGRAVDGGEDAQVVAGGRAAVGSPDALERRALGLRDVVRRHRVGAVVGLADERAVGDVVGVHVVAPADLPVGEADDLAVLAHRLALGDVGGRDLVPARHLDVDVERPPALGVVAWFEVLGDENDVVVAAQPDGDRFQRGRGRSGGLLSLGHRTRVGLRAVRPQLCRRRRARPVSQIGHYP